MDMENIKYFLYGIATMFLEWKYSKVVLWSLGIILLFAIASILTFETVIVLLLYFIWQEIRQKN
jgi:hypothetical protein